MQICGLALAGLVLGCHRTGPPKPPSPSYRIALQYDATLTRIEKVEIEKKPYIRLQHPAAIHATRKIGSPALPQDPVYLVLPPDATNVRVALEVVSSQTVASDANVEPLQPPKPTSTFPFSRGGGPPLSPPATPGPVAFDEQMYTSAAAFPPEVATLEEVATRYGAKVAVLRVAPFVFYPREKRTEIRTSLVGALTFDSALPTSNLYKDLSPAQRDALIHTVANPGAIAPVSPSAAVAPLTSQADYVMPDLRPAKHDTVPYVIITPEALSESFKPFVNWKIHKGVDTRVVTVKWIESRYPGVDLANKIRNFILDAKAKWGASWILLGGDVDQVPSRLGIYDSYTSSYGPSDLYFSDLNTNWNSNGDQIFGEPLENDAHPDIFVGRVPVQNTAQVAVFVSKVLLYEQNPPAGYVESALFMAVSEEGFVFPPYSPLHCDLDKEALIQPPTRFLPLGFNVKRMYDSPSTLLRDFLLERDQAIAQVNQGFHIINHMDHCGIQSMGTGSAAKGGSIDNAAVDGFTNGRPGSIVWTYGCDPNAFDYDSISEHWMQNSNGGAVAFVGNTRTGYGWQSWQDTQFFTSWFTTKLRHLGTIFSTTQDGGQYESGAMNLLGDPEMVVWNVQPTPLTLVGLGAITIGSNPLNFTVGGLAANEEATVTFRGPEVYAGGQTIGGTLAGTLVVHTGSTLDLVVTSPDRKPLLVSVPVGVSPGAHLYVSGVQIIDNTGNGNQQLEPGESAVLRVTVTNGGGADSATGTALLATSTTGVTISSPQLLPVVATAASKYIDFPISLPHGFSDGDALLFVLTTDGAGVEQTNVHVPVFAPVLEQTHVYDDSAGNGNLLPQRGETVKFGLHVINNGFGDAYGVTATLTTTSGPAVTITQPLITIGNVLAKSVANTATTFAFTLDNTFDGTVHTVDLTLTDSLGNTTTRNIKLVVPPPPAEIAYRSTVSSIIPRWKAAAVSDRNYRIYRSDTASGPYATIEPFLVRDGALYEDTTINPSQPSYFYHVSIVDPSGNESAPAQVEGFTSLPSLDGFPRPVLREDEFIRGSTVAFDIDGDGKKEIFANVGHHESENHGVLYAWNSAGNELISKGDPNFAEFATLDGTNFGAPAFANIDNDGHTDIIVNGKYKVFAFRADGSPVAGWAGGIAIPKPNSCMNEPPTVESASPVVADLEGDGKLEVITTAFDWGNYCDGSRGHVYVFDYKGAIKATYHVSNGNYSFATPTVGDLNADGKPEVVIPFSTGEIFVLDTANSTSLIVTVPGGSFPGGASLADLDGDGRLDIIVASPASRRVYAVHLNGTPVNGWQGGRPINAGDTMAGMAIAAADLDCDGRPELALGTERHVYVWEHDGALKNGWPVTRENKPGEYFRSTASPLFADVSGDGQLDVVIGSSSLVDGGLIYAWDARTAAPIKAFPQFVPEIVSGTCAIADIDGDGSLELAQGARRHMYVYKTGGRALDAFTPWPNIDRDAVHTSALRLSDMGAACCTTPPAGVVAWWPFNETVGATASEITGGHDGTYQNGPVPVAGMVGGALGFDGVDSYVTVPHDPTLNLSGQFTLDFWIKPDASETRGTIYRKGTLSATHDLLLGGPGFHLLYGSGHFWGCLSGTSGFQVDFSPTFTHHAPPGIWTFVALTVDLTAATAKLYINGQLAQTSSVASVGSMANTAPVIIGGTDIGPSATRSFAGALDELQFENRALTLQEVEKIYQAGPAGKCFSIDCLGPLVLQVGTGDGYAAFSPDEAGGIYSCDSGIGDPNLPGIRFDPLGPLPAANSNCSTALFVFDQAGTRRQVLGIHTAASNTCPCTSPPAPYGPCFYEPLCPPNDVAHLTCSDVISDSGVITISAGQKRRITDFALPNFPGLKVHLIQDVFMDRLEQTYQFTNTSSSTYNLRLSRAAEIDLSYVDDGSATGTPLPNTGGSYKNIPGFVPFGAQIHDNVMTGSNHTPFASVTVTAPAGGDATFEGARLQGDGGSSHARLWWNYGVPPSELNLYGVDGNYWTVTWTGDPATPSESDQAMIVQSLLTIPAGQTKTYVTHTLPK